MSTRTGGARHNGRQRAFDWMEFHSDENLISSRASCPRKRDRASRKDWISSLSATRDEGPADGANGGRGERGATRRRENRTAGRSGVDCARSARDATE